MNDFAPMIVAVTLFSVSGWVLVQMIRSRRAQAIARSQGDLQQRLLDRFGSGEELSQFLATPAGERFLATHSQDEGGASASRILGAVQSGVIFLFAGVALLYLSERIDDVEQGLLICGSLVTAIGAGFLTASALTYRLAKGWGLLRSATTSDDE